MKRVGISCFTLLAVGLLAANVWAGGRLDELIDQTNRSAGLKLPMQPVVDDATFLRRIYVDLIGRIPTEAEVREFAQMPVQGRRDKLVDKLLQDGRFTDRWTIFYADMLRLRSNATGGQALIAYVHQAVEQGMPYDEMARRLIAMNGKAGKIPEAGFVLSDNADPLAMASITSQVFMGIRIGCAQCHDHPFDVWTRKDFYDVAAYFGKTRRYESELTKVVYTTEMEQTVILWPPEGEVPAKDRKPLAPRFPFEINKFEKKPEYVVRMEKIRQAKADAIAAANKPTVDDILAETSLNANRLASGRTGETGAIKETKKDLRSIDIQASLYRKSDYRQQLAAAVTDPGNRYFSRSFVNRVWKTLIGRGFVEPVDDFREDNPAVHPAAMDYLADEFVASDFDLRTLVRLVVISDAYQRAHAPREADELTRGEMENNLLATPVRRMIAEAMFDSVITAGHLFATKHSPGKNEKTIVEKVRVAKSAKPGELAKPGALVAANNNPAMAGMAGMSGPMAMAGGGYALENAIEVDFGAVLREAAKEEVAVESMQAMSREEIEAMRMTQERGGRMQYEEKLVSKVIDDNPVYNTSLRMQSPAPNGHFLQVFGQPNRSDLGDLRDDSASMRQALMMLNGKFTHEAARVGDLEPMYKLLTGKSPDLDGAIKLAYLEILTRRPTADELSEARQIIADGSSPLDGMADLRWVLINCNEFRFLP